MEFIEQVKQFSKRFENVKGIKTEEATKTSLIMPFFTLLGYDVFNPNEFIPEFTADVGIKKGEKVDYAILINGEPVILVEAKWLGDKLKKHTSQLYRYFSVTKAKFAILTNGRLYKFYTDLEEENKMDEKPFLEFDILNIKDQQIKELFKFSKSVFNIESILDIASELKYTNEFKNIFSNELEHPSDEFVRFFLKNTYDGTKTKAVIERFRPILKKSLNDLITEIMSERLSYALDINPEIKTTQSQKIKENNKIENLLKQLTDLNASYEKNDNGYIITFNDIEVCKIIKYKRYDQLFIQQKDGIFERFYIDSIDDIENYKDMILSAIT